MDLKNLQGIYDTPLENTKDRIALGLEMRDLKPIDLSNMTGIPKSSISQYMSGYAIPKSDRIAKIAKALNVSEAWLMGFPVEPTRNTVIEGYTNEDKFLISTFHQLDAKSQRHLLMMARTMLKEQ